MTKIIKLNPKKEFKIVRKKYPKTLPFITEKEQRRKKLMGYLLEEDKDLSKNR